MRFSKRYPNGFSVPTFHPERLHEPFLWKKRKIGKRHEMVFTSSMGDFFDKHVNREWQQQVIDVIGSNRDMAFQILTKQPQNIPVDIDYPKNLWLGVSVTSNVDLWRIDKLMSLKSCGCHEGYLFCSFEPLLENLVIPKQSGFSSLNWVIIGIQTNPVVVIPYEYIDRLYKYANDANIPVFCKDSIVENYNRITKEKNQKYPEIPWEKY